MTLVLGTLLIAVAACTGSAGESPSSDLASERPVVTAVPSGSEPAPSSAAGGGSTWPVDQGALDQVLAKAAAKTGQDASTLTIVSAEAVTWPNGAMGCPKPGSMYTEALVEGYRVVVSTGDRDLDYRMSATGEPRLCDRPGPAGASGG